MLQSRLPTAKGPRSTSLVSLTSLASLVLLAALPFACSRADAPSEASGDDEINPRPPPRPSERPWRDDPCGQGIEQACSAPFRACDADPVCARRLACLKQCAAEGVLTTDCAADCGEAPRSGEATALGEVYRCVEANQQPPCGTGTVAPILPVLTQQCGASTDANACYRCEDEYCCETYEDCAQDAECQSYKECVKQCPRGQSYHDCPAACAKEHPAGAERFAPRRACLLHHCADAGACGEKPLDACERCARDRCGDVQAACEQRVSCSLLGQCVADCDTLDQTCAFDCFDQYPAERDYIWRIGECVTQFCPSC